MAAQLTQLPNPPAVRNVSPGVRLVIGGVVFIAAAIFILTLRHPRQGPSLRDLTPSGDKWWTREARPTPVATPRPQPHVAVTRPIIVQAAPIPKPTATPCQICIERAMRYQRAIETGMGTASIATNIHELPQMVPTPQSAPTPLVLMEQP